MSGQTSPADSIIALFTIIIILLIISAVLPLLQNITCEEYIKEINRLKEENQNLREQLNLKESEIIKLKSLITSMNKSLTQKDETITKLLIELNKTKKENELLKNEITYYEEKRYITEIHNYFINVTNKLTKIENKIIYLQIEFGIISASIITIIEIQFNPIRQLFKKIKERIKK